jgi:hypothetical protein
MSRKRATNKNILGMLAFASLLISGVCYVLSLLKIGGGILPIVGNGLLLIVVLWTAWEFTANLSQVWKFIYFILAILAITGFILGVGIKL